VSVDELRGQITILLRTIDLLERQGVEGEAEVLTLKQDVRGLRERVGQLLDKLQPSDGAVEASPDGDGGNGNGGGGGGGGAAPASSS